MIGRRSYNIIEMKYTSFINCVRRVSTYYPINSVATITAAIMIIRVIIGGIIPKMARQCPY